MAFKASSFLALVLISNILLATTVAGRSIAENTNSEDKKEPQFLFKSDGRVHIPGIGHLGFPPKHHFAPHNPFTGGNGGAGTGSGSASEPRSGSPGRSYVPGGDDTFVPNPGYEVPIPGSAGNVPTPVHP
ncbi:putative cell wall protein [Cajanus cajan]|uniref:Cell wall protein n=1 Tax=Cajanus cajan TaxID=3821 RepID=A0A151TP63_CAJCA|nr:putative cell wall protein [Cajanus cajan]KYP68842.1 Putative cell wall protein [Cajanus cajan]